MQTVSTTLFVVAVTIIVKIRCHIHRLPGNVKPVRYILTIEPELDPIRLKAGRNLFNGSITMQLKTIRNTKSVIFNVNHLEINYRSIRITKDDGTEITVQKTSFSKYDQICDLQLNTELIKGEHYNLTIGYFSGKLSIGEGLFKAFYRRNKDIHRTFLTTHFQPSAARSAFPCFDEPALKARFIVKLIRRDGWTTRSNEELERTENLGDGRFKDTFKETPLMSTYILAFAIFDFNTTKKVERHQIFANPEDIITGQLDYALTTAVKTLRVLEELTRINFTLNKIDSFSLPRKSFKSWAMENWGLVIFGEDYLKYSNQSEEHFRRKKQVATTIAHEFAHQWFGNLVTPEWWDCIWLSESFAAFFQHYVASLVEPEWRLMDQFLVDVVHDSFAKEEFDHEDSHSLTYRITRIGQYPPFHIMYQKGGSIVRMVSHFLTENIFQKGLRVYLQKRQFDTAVPSDLYDAFQECLDEANANNLLGDLSVADILNSWDVKGFPIVNVIRNYISGSITISQYTSFEQENTNKNWNIPINYVFSASKDMDFSKTTADFWLSSKSRTINNNFPTAGWLLVNKQQTGYYIVNYDRENWEQLIQFLKSDMFENIHVLSRAQLLHDAFFLFRLEEISADILFSLCEYLVQEKDYIPWAAFYDGIMGYTEMSRGGYSETERTYFLNHTLAKDVPNLEEANVNKDLEVYKKYMQHLTQNLRNYLGNEDKADETILDNFNRIKLNYFTWRLRRRGLA